MLKRVVVILAVAASALAQSTRNDYSDPKTWLCRPGRQDACVVDMNASWGLHLIDVNLAMGNLVDSVGQQARAYLRANRKSQ